MQGNLLARNESSGKNDEPCKIIGILIRSYHDRDFDYEEIDEIKYLVIDLNGTTRILQGYKCVVVDYIHPAIH